MVGSPRGGCDHVQCSDRRGIRGISCAASLSGAESVIRELIRAVAVLRAGGLVAFPTETVYGLGADATNSEAVRKIYAAKGRPSSNPLICHVADANVARRYAREWPDAAAK